MHKDTNIETTTCGENFYNLLFNGNNDTYQNGSGPDDKNYDNEGCNFVCNGDLIDANYLTPIKDKFEVFQCSPTNWANFKTMKYINSVD